MVNQPDTAIWDSPFSGNTRFCTRFCTLFTAKYPVLYPFYGEIPGFVLLLGQIRAQTPTLAYLRLVPGYRDTENH